MARRLTERQRKSKQAKKIKARQQWQYSLWCKMRSCLLLVVFTVLATLGYGMVTGEVQQRVADVVGQTHQRIASTGLAVARIDLSGRQRTGMSEVTNALGFELGEPMLRLDLDAVKASLEEIPTVKSAAVERKFPDRVIVHLNEREPVAVWQYKGELKLIDELGAVMSDLNLHQYKDLPQLVGKGAPEHVEEVLAMLEYNDALASQVGALIRVSNRRWDVRFKQGITVKLPEENHKKAWEKVAALHAEQQLLMRHIEAIDMRNDERMYITVAPAYGKEPTPTKDT